MCIIHIYIYIDRYTASRGTEGQMRKYENAASYSTQILHSAGKQKHEQIT